MSITGASDPDISFGDYAGTAIAVDPRRPRSACSSDSVAVGWTSALARLQDKRARHPDAIAVGLIVYGSRPRTKVLFLPLDARAPLALTVGRHPRCDVAGLRGASGRHAVVLAWPRPRDGTPPLEVLDLRSASGLVLRDGRELRRLASPGPLRFGVGSVEVALLYAAPGARFPVELPDELDDWAALEDLVAGGLTRPVMPDDLHDLDEHTNFSVVSRVAGGFRRLRDGAPVDLREHQVVRVRSDELRRGVLLGRYERCRHVEAFAGNHLVSRVHALALQRRGRLFVIDTGSTNGTDIVAPSGERVRHLDDHGRVHRLRSLEGLRIGGRRVAFELLDVQ